jgi:hypothetical protein
MKETLVDVFENQRAQLIWKPAIENENTSTVEPTESLSLKYIKRF